MNKYAFTAGFVALLCLTAFRNPPGALRYGEMADKFLSEGNTDLAFEYYSRAVALEPANPAHYTTRGFFLLKSGRAVDALKDFSAAISLEPQNPTGYLARGLVYSELRKTGEANEDFAAACSLGSAAGCSFAAKK